MMNTKRLLSEPVSKSGYEYRVNAFLMMLYPDEDVSHSHFISWIKDHPIYRYVYIVHDKDVYSEDEIEDESLIGSPKKSHTHFLLIVPEKTTISAFLRFFQVWIKYAEPCRDVTSTIMYMLHDTPNSIHKHRYNVTELKGDESLIKKVCLDNAIIQKTNLVELMKMLQDTDGRITSLLQEVCTSLDDSLFDTFSRYQSLICTASRQEAQYKFCFQNRENFYKELAYAINKGYINKDNFIKELLIYV